MAGLDLSRNSQLDGFEPGGLAKAGRILGRSVDPVLAAYPALPAPRYRPMSSAGWQLREVLLPAAPGYFGGHALLTEPTPILARDGVPWMSLLPSEVESQQPHLAAARGTVVVCGLGMGLMAYALAARRCVGRVVVVERDSDLVGMFAAFAGFERWPQRAKVEIVVEDARTFRMTGADFLYVDIWPHLRMDAMVRDMAEIHAHVPAPACGYWGQELDMIDAAVAAGVALEQFGTADVTGFAAAHGLPLIGAALPRYAELCRRAAQSTLPRRQRIPIASDPTNHQGRRTPS